MKVILALAVAASPTLATAQAASDQPKDYILVVRWFQDGPDVRYEVVTDNLWVQCFAMSAEGDLLAADISFALSETMAFEQMDAAQIASVECRGGGRAG